MWAWERYHLQMEGPAGVRQSVRPSFDDDEKVLCRRKAEAEDEAEGHEGGEPFIG